MTYGTKKVQIPTKIWKIKQKDGTKELLAGCGNWDQVKGFVAWYESKALNGEVEGEEPRFLEAPMIAEASFSMLNDRGEIWYLSGQGQWVEISEDHHTMGSGGDFALGALEAGATEEKALKIAHKYDAHTGHLITKSKV